MALLGHRPEKIIFFYVSVDKFLPVWILLIEFLCVFARMRFGDGRAISFAQLIDTLKIKCFTIYSCRLSQFSVDLVSVFALHFIFFVDNANAIASPNNIHFDP